MWSGKQPIITVGVVGEYMYVLPRSGNGNGSSSSRSSSSARQKMACGEIKKLRIDVEGTLYCKLLPSRTKENDRCNSE